METYQCPGPAPPQTAHEGPHPDCPECGPDYAPMADHGVCTRAHCDLPTVDDDVCWWCRNEDADTYFAVETDA